MFSVEHVQAQLQYTLSEVEIPELLQHGARAYRGKVRDCYILGDKRILIATDRLSAFDRVLTTIPFKGQVLNAMTSYWFRETADIVQNHILAEPHANVFICREIEMLPVEVIVRGYLTGSAWRDYEKGNAISGIKLSKGLKKSQRFPEPLITPSTKAEHGAHDEPISSEDVVRSGLVDASLWREVCATALKLFDFGTKRSAENGLIMVDTKYEFGTVRNSAGVRELVVADEIHTADSSRYWISNSYASRFERGEEPQMLDKEFVRSWLIQRDYMGEGTPPVIPDDFRVEVAQKYIQVCEKITGQDFKAATGDIQSQVRTAILASL